MRRRIRLTLDIYISHLRGDAGGPPISVPRRPPTAHCISQCTPAWTPWASMTTLPWLVRGARAHDCAHTLTVTRRPEACCIIFWGPEIPGNTGAAIRLSTYAGSMLHLVKPLGSTWLMRSCACGAGLPRPRARHGCMNPLDDALAGSRTRVGVDPGMRRPLGRVYADGDGLLFGRESVEACRRRREPPAREEVFASHMREGVRSFQLGQFSIDRPVRGMASAGLPGRRLALANKPTGPGPDCSAPGS